MADVATLRVLGLAEAAWGLVLLGRGDAIWRAAGGGPQTQVDRTAVRVLGFRELLQGCWRVARPKTGTRALAALEVAHAASLLPLLKSETRGGPVRLSIALAALSAVVGAAVNRQGGKCCSRS